MSQHWDLISAKGPPGEMTTSITTAHLFLRKSSPDCIISGEGIESPKASKLAKKPLKPHPKLRWVIATYVCRQPDGHELGGVWLPLLSALGITQTAYSQRTGGGTRHSLGQPGSYSPKQQNKPFFSILQVIPVLPSLEGEVDPALPRSPLQNGWGYSPGTSEVGAEGIKAWGYS